MNSISARLFISVFLLAAVSLSFVGGARAGFRDKVISITVNGDSKVSVFKDLKVDKGEKYNSVVVIGGDLVFAGEADDVVVLMGSARLEPASVVNDDFLVLFGNSVMADGASVGGQNINIESGNFLKKFLTFIVLPGVIFTTMLLPPVIIITKLFLFAIAFGLALLLFHLFPGITSRSKEALKNRMLASFLWGILALLLVVPLFVFFLVSIVGIPLIPLYFVFLFIIFLGGMAVSGHYVGQALPAKIFKENDILALLAGLGIICAVSFIPLLGQIVKWIALSAGLGAVLTALLRPLKRN